MLVDVAIKYTLMVCQFNQVFFFLFLKATIILDLTLISLGSNMVPNVPASPSVCPDGVGRLTTFNAVSLRCVECNGTV